MCNSEPRLRLAPCAPRNASSGPHLAPPVAGVLAPCCRDRPARGCSASRRRDGPWWCRGNLGRAAGALVALVLLWRNTASGRRFCHCWSPLGDGRKTPTRAASFSDNASRMPAPFCGRALPLPRKTDLVVPHFGNGHRSGMSTSRHLVIALAIAGAFSFAATRASAQDTDWILLHLRNLATHRRFDLQEGRASGCGQIQPGDVKRRTKELQRQVHCRRPLRSSSAMKAARRTANDGGGAVVFELAADKHAFRSFQPGSHTHECVTAPKDPRRAL